VTWEIELRGGASHVEANLADVAVSGVAVTGGASDVRLVLGRAAGVVPVRFTGGVSAVTVVRPDGVAARLRLTGGASSLAFDRQRLGAVGGKLSLESPDYRTAEDRYEVEVTGGASHLEVSTGAA
jgi:hypothetical protein